MQLSGDRFPSKAPPARTLVERRGDPKTSLHRVPPHGIIGGVIQSFADKATQRAWERRFVRRLGPDVTRRAYRKLQALDAATVLSDLASPPGNRLEPLVGDRAGQHSVRINDQFRVCFTWTISGPADVEIIDYH